MNEFIGHFHPVLVHLPIGVLMLACFFYLLPQKYSHLHAAVPAMLFWGSIAAIFSCITGFFLSKSGGYDASLVGWHQWMGIGVALISAIMYFLFRILQSPVLLKTISVILLGLIAATGHLGGSLTHGSDYLSLNFINKDTIIAKPIADVQKAIVYQDLVQPVLQNKCYSCHGPEKQKGKLRLDMQDRILKGGENGLAVVPGDAEKSELIKRLLLSVSNEDHMPPKEKPQLTENEIALLHWWINSGADFQKKSNELKQPENIKMVLASFQSGNNPAVQQKVSEIPQKEIEAADPKVVEWLKGNNIVVLPVLLNSNYLSVNFLNAKIITDSVMKQLIKLNRNVVWLKMDNVNVNDQSLDAIKGFNNLVRLHLNNTGITNSGLSKLKKLSKLNSLSLVGTTISASGLMQLKGLRNLRSLYLYQTKVEKKDWPDLKKAFPKTYLDFGDYIVPTFASDTTEVKRPELKVRALIN